MPLVPCKTRLPPLFLEMTEATETVPSRFLSRADGPDVRALAVARVPRADQRTPFRRAVGRAVIGQDFRDGHLAGLDVVVAEREFPGDRPLELRVGLGIHLAAARHVIASEAGIFPLDLVADRKQIIARDFRLWA